ncbi:DUF1792 domain-containing protein [Streptococcus thermophilus]|nr:DUF1792 domain-containing protein [Streptococcus thermophilus]MCE2198550.1 DUF1792 domain-containing protein [Streptococcus thermophilus]MCE2244309.1 DUF1792 domain-containing protein [Streptococcus thermophilus]MCE2252473.1 DUF1792 domain-containing protein [Streptococcus thermophilus]MCE2253741.1 DUF1792 domain-containing protein [Streptococcus thermophilus]
MVEGEKTNFGYDNDLLGTAAEVSKIIVPSKNAFSKYEQILELTRETIKTYDKKLDITISHWPHSNGTVLRYSR